MNPSDAIEAAARAYFELVRRRDAPAVARLYAEDGVLALPNGERYAGPAAIEAFYRKLFATAPPQPSVHAIIAQGDRCLAEIVAEAPDGTLGRVADVFTFDGGGRIRELLIYARTAP